MTCRTPSRSPNRRGTTRSRSSTTARPASPPPWRRPGSGRATRSRATCTTARRTWRRCSPPSSSARCQSTPITATPRTNSPRSSPTPTPPPWCSAAASRPTWSTPSRPSRRCAFSSAWARHRTSPFQGEGGASAVRDAPELADLYAATAPRPREPRPGSDELFMYTGGTTGKPKGVIWHMSQLFGSMGPGLFSRLGVAEPPATLDDLVAIARSVRAAGRSPVVAVGRPADARDRPVQQHGHADRRRPGRADQAGQARPAARVGDWWPRSASAPSSWRATPCASRSSTSCSRPRPPGGRTT